MDNKIKSHFGVSTGLSVITPKDQKENKLFTISQVAKKLKIDPFLVGIIAKLGIVDCVIGKYNIRIYKSEFDKILQYFANHPDFVKDNIIYGIKDLGFYVFNNGGKPSWAKEIAKRLIKTTAYLGCIKEKIYKKDVCVPIFLKQDVLFREIEMFVKAKKRTGTINRAYKFVKVIKN